MPATIAISDLLRFVKAGSSRFMSHDLRPNSSFAWQGSYGAFSVSARDKATVANYINNQREHHREGRTWASVEPGDGTDETETDDTAG